MRAFTGTFVVLALAVLVLVGVTYFRSRPDDPNGDKDGNGKTINSGGGSSSSSGNGGNSNGGNGVITPTKTSEERNQEVGRSDTERNLEALYNEFLKKEKDRNSRAMKAFYTAIRIHGPYAIPALQEVLSSKETDPLKKLIALNALSGIRRMARELPLHMEAEKSLPYLLEHDFKGMTEQTLKNMLAYGAWPSEMTDLMIQASWENLNSNGSREVLEDAVSNLYSLGLESKVATEKLLEFVGTTGVDSALRTKALGHLKDQLDATGGEPIARIAMNRKEDMDFRLQAAIMYFRIAENENLPVRSELSGSLGVEAQRMIYDDRTEMALRSKALQMVGYMEGAASHPLMTSMLDAKNDDALRMAALSVLLETKGTQAAAAQIRAMAKETGGGAAPLLAKRIEATLPPE